MAVWKPHNNAIFPNDNMVPYCCGFNDGVGSDVNVVSNLHRIVVKISAIRLVWRPELRCHLNGCNRTIFKQDVPHHAALTHKAVPPKRDDDGMARTCSAKISPNDCAAGNNSLSSKDDVLRSGDGCSSRDFVPCVLIQCQQLIHHDAWFSAYGFNEFSL